MSFKKDSWLILRKTGFSKVSNLLLLRLSFVFSRIRGVARIMGSPMALTIEPTTACNLSCPECPSGLKSFSRPVGNISLDTNKRIIDQLHKKLWYINYYFQGEPFIHKNFLDMVKYASSKGIYTSTSTNAHFITKDKAIEIIQSGLDRLIVSVDGLTQETYVQYRKDGSLEKVLEGIRHIISEKKKAKKKSPHVIFQFLVLKSNEHEVADVMKFAGELGVDEVWIKTAQFYDFENGNALMPDDENYSRYKRNINGNYVLKNKLQNKCWRMWSSCVITWDGKVAPCCFDKDAKYTLGDSSKISFAEIWKSEMYNSFRNQILTSRKDIDICRNCTEGTKVFD